jgi:hypothetical protein
MKYKILTIIGFIGILIAGLVPANVFAATSASVYVSPSSSSVVKGNNITVQVRVNSGTNPMDSAQASLNFTSSLLQYVSYSPGAFSTTVQASASGGSFSYAGAILGSSTSSNQLMFSVTLKAIATGSATLSISGANIAYAGTGFDSVGTSNGSVNITAPVSSNTGKSSSSSSAPAPTSSSSSSNTYTPPSASTSTATANKDTTPPKLVAAPTLTVGQNTISLKFNTDEKAKIQINYTIGELVKSIVNNTLTTSHSIAIGDNQPLLAGTTYAVQIIATDSFGNKAVIYSQNVRTTGVNYTVQITDMDGQPLANYPVQIFSNPIDATTNANGVVTFKDMTPGEHTLVFVIDGLTLRQPVNIAQPVANNKLSQNTYNNVVSIKLPIRFADTATNKPQNINNYLLLAIASIITLGAAIVTIFKIKQSKRFTDWFHSHFGKSTKIILDQDDSAKNIVAN